jgi:hypothetical protein
MSTDLAVTLIALLLALWAINWARRAANNAERTAIAAEKSALAAERSALAAKRAAEAAEFSALAARQAASGADTPSDGVPAQATPTRVDAAVKELIDSWPRDASAWPLVERNPTLADGEVEEIIQKAFHLLGRTEAEAKHHSVAVLNLRHDQSR